MSGCKQPSSPISVQLKSVSPDGTVIVRQLSLVEAKAQIDEHYRRLELTKVRDLLRMYFHIVDAQEFCAASFLSAFRQDERELRAMKREDLRRAGISSRKQPQEPSKDRPDVPKDPTVIALWRAFCKKGGDPFPMEDLVPWAREQLKDDVDLSDFLRYGLDFEQAANPSAVPDHDRSRSPQ
jgi:hypothetical protein